MSQSQSVPCPQGQIVHQGTFTDLTKQGVSLKHFLPDLEQEDLSANQNERNIPSTDSSEATSMRQKLWLDHFYSSDEALDKIWLQFEVRPLGSMSVVFRDLICRLQLYISLYIMLYLFKVIN